jgi:hypothetical protein
MLSAETINGTSIKFPFGQMQPARTPQILYHGGPIMLGSVRVYLIYYGTMPSATSSIVNDFFSNLSGSGQYNVNTTYYDAQNNFIMNSLTFSPATSIYVDPYSIGKTVTGRGVQKIVQNALQGGHLPIDEGAIYFVLTAPDVTAQGYCSSFCAYHSNSTSIISGKDIKFSLVPGAPCTGCDGNIQNYGENNTPNGDLAGDEMTDSIIHELSEAVTDPDISAWFTRSGAENGDLCNFNYGTTYIAPNGTHANAHLGDRDYLIQTIWQNTGQGFCANTLP